MEPEAFLPVVFRYHSVGPTSVCGIWPLSFYTERWNELECWQEGDPEDTGVFYMFSDDRLESEDCWFPDDEPPDCPKVCDVCNCTTIPPHGEQFLIGTGDRSWLNFPRPDEGDPDPCDNCGAVQTVCWIAAGGYTGVMSIPGDGTGLCLPSQDGVAASILHEIEDQIGDTPNILLWDRECTEDEPVTGTCPGMPENIVSWGCIEILDVPVVALEPMPGYDENDCATLSNVKTMKARKLCDCDPECGSAALAQP
jgi:hypothetical protein